MAQYSLADLLKSLRDPYETGGKVTDATGSPLAGYLANIGLSGLNMQFGHGPFAAAAPVPISKIGKLSTEALAEALKRTSYENVPNSLMGFKRFGPQKEWADQGYKYIQYVKIKWPDGTTSIDAQKGLNAQHALERAYRNWMDASEITPISKEEAIKLDPSASGW